MIALKDYFRCNRRLNRRPYFNICFLPALVLLPLYFYFLMTLNPADVQAIADLSHQLSGGKITQAVFDAQSQEINARVAAKMAPLFILAIISSLLLLPAGIMRLKDLNTPLKLLIPLIVFTTFMWSPASEKLLPHPVHQVLGFVALMVALVMAFKRGTVGDNQYGPDPLAGLPVVKTRWLLMVGLLVGAIAAIFIFMYVSMKTQ